MAKQFWHPGGEPNNISFPGGEVNTEVQSIIDSIGHAFLGVCRGKITLHEAEVIDEYGSMQACLQARAQDQDCRWEEIPDDHIESCTTALCHVDPESWRYYIAPYMIWSLRHYRTNDSTGSDGTIYILALPGEDGETSDYLMERYRLLDGAQCRCVCYFLRYMSRNGDFADDRVAHEALRKYWGRFCEPDVT